MSVWQLHLYGHLTLEKPGSLDWMASLSLCQWALASSFPFLANATSISLAGQGPVWNVTQILLALFNPMFNPRAAPSGLRSKHVLYLTVCLAKLDPLLPVVSARFCLGKGNFSYLKWKSNLLSDPLKWCECLGSPAFYPTTLTSIREPCLNQLLPWWLKNGHFSNCIISSVF